MPKVLACSALLLLSASSSYAQWERIVVAWTGKGESWPVTQGSPHPLQYYLTPSPERDPINSLNLGERVAAHEITLQDYVVETSQRTLGESFGRKVVEIVLTFRETPEVQELEAARENGGKPPDPQSSEGPVPIQWKSVVMESSSDAYRELYLLINNGMWDRDESKASVYSVEGSQILGVEADPSAPYRGNTYFCEGSYWLLGTDGPQLIDFTAVEKEVKRVITQDATLVEPLCAAIDMKELELRGLAQRIKAECHACDYLGSVTVRFRLDGHRAIPVSSRFEPGEAP